MSARARIDDESGLSPLTKHLLGLLAYYAGLALLVFLLRDVPAVRRVLVAPEGGPVRVTLPGAAAHVPAPISHPAAAAVAIAGSLLVAFPVAWVYVLTRRRKGFLQAIVHTLLMLPVAVSGVILLIQDSLALAFSLAGIAAAVRFRNTLDDTKDAVYILLVTGVGIAAGVSSLGIAFVMSALFNAVTLVLWWTEFGRSPFDLEGSPAFRKLERARKEQADGGAFVGALDREVLASMSTDQLEAIAEKAWRRRLLVDDRPEGRRFPYNAIVLVHTAAPDAAQPLVEAALEDESKRWELWGLRPGEGGFTTLEYRVRLGRSVSRDELLGALRARGAPHVTGVELKKA